jgi:hypothetical protein
MPIGAAIGAVIGGAMVDKLSRRNCLMIADALGIVASLFFIPAILGTLITGRFLTGIFFLIFLFLIFYYYFKKELSLE